MRHHKLFDECSVYGNHESQWHHCNVYVVLGPTTKYLKIDWWNWYLMV